MDPSNYRTFTVSRGFVYNVYHVPAAAGKPTLLFMHGFPSSSYDWRRQLPHFAERGNGIVAPDMLGAGESSKPLDSKAFHLGARAQDVVELLDALGLAKVVGIATDWGGIFMSRLSMLHQDRFSGLAWLGVGFRPADLRPIDRESDCDMYAYWQFFMSPNAADTIHKNIDSFMQWVYPKDPNSWVTWMLTPGKTAECIESNILLGRPDWFLEEEYAKVRQDLLTNGVASGLLWYANELEGNDNDESLRIPQEAYAIKVPALFIGASKDVLLRESAGLVQMRKHATALHIASVDAGHYLHIEAAEEVNRILEEWIVTVPL
ncbi:alpha/beta hydrolase [Phanerochaete sordida]|uniref:Alpha/beta hydrolase n=1 Tax=Phanerochaete sordida TaxID=48140 RepID=A0A9P3GGX1_9APHY|nr:alpha/beta hydrolase [Phanerochaete sordida]